MVVHNEAHRLERTLMLLRQHVQKLVVVDNGSTDGSIAIANKWADVVYPVVYRPRSEHRSSLNIPAAEVGEWMLSVDADEELTEPCAQSLAAMVANHEVDCWGLLRRSRVFYKDRVETTELMHHIRLFRVGSILQTTELHTPPWPVNRDRYAETKFLAMEHDKADWEQRLDVMEYDAEGVLGPDAENVRRKWALGNIVDATV